jgi:CRP-like cAMP-binding protein
MAKSAQSPNMLLASLPAADFASLQPHLKPLEMAQGTVLFAAGDRVDRVYFPHSGVISLVVDLAAGETIEAAMIGRDSIVGGSSALDGRVSLNKAIIQVAGVCSVLDVERFRQFADSNKDFRTTLIRHEQVLFAQAQQGAACNVSHTIEARLARWLLRTRDLCGSEKLPLTQEFLGQMLGVQRSSVSLVAHTLQQGGLIRYSRGHIEIINLEGLRESACECYGSVKAHYDRLLNGAGA